MAVEGGGKVPRGGIAVIHADVGHIFVHTCFEPSSLAPLRAAKSSPGSISRESCRTPTTPTSASPTIVAPLTTWSFTFLAGTGHIVYPLLPVIYETAHQSGIRPERPMAVATIASQQAITASPVAAAACG